VIFGMEDADLPTQNKDDRIKSAEKNRGRRCRFESCHPKGEMLPETNRDHELSGNWRGYRECHIQSDWLLVYRVENDILVLTLARAGSHSDLFGK